jgi:restriction system protein
LNRAGYHARLTPASGDGGVDIVLGDGTIVQCKTHRSPASPGVVRELYGTLIHQNAPKAMLVSLSGVTSGVHSFIKDKPITVWNKTNLIALQKSLDES